MGERIPSGGQLIRVVVAALAITLLGPVVAGAQGRTLSVDNRAKPKHCKKTQVLKKGRCVAKPKPQAPAPDPLSDADGDAIPYKWEAPESTPKPKPKKCKRGQVRKHGKCVKKHSGKSKRASASVTAGTASVAKYGASPNHKDIFIEIDYASQALKDNMSCSELDALVAAFANAPVSNPDGKSGINLHTPQVADINGDGQLTVLPATHDEWSTLDYASGGQIGPG